MSVLSFVFLLIGVRQRRDVPTGAAAAASPVPAQSASDEDSDVHVVPASSAAPASGLTTGAEVKGRGSADRCWAAARVRPGLMQRRRRVQPLPRTVAKKPPCQGPGERSSEAGRSLQGRGREVGGEGSPGEAASRGEGRREEDDRVETSEGGAGQKAARQEGGTGQEGGCQEGRRPALKKRGTG